MNRPAAWLHSVLLLASCLASSPFALPAITTAFIPLRMEGSIAKVVLDKNVLLEYKDAFTTEFDRYIFLRDFLECVPSGENAVNVECVKFFNAVTYSDVHYAIAFALGYYIDDATGTITQARSEGNEEFWHFANDDGEMMSKRTCSHHHYYVFITDVPPN